ncbi:MAG: hypothetical protein JXA20_16025 [Spirochaetes bacterium]|nr:hypothetical protein [Spirochaetota bacterium]
MYKTLVSMLLLAGLVMLPALAGAQEPVADEGEFQTAGEPTSGSPFSQSKFVPDISLILDASYVYRSLKNGQFRATSSPEYTEVPMLEGIHDETEPFSRRGLNFNYAEITFASVVDPFFDLFAVCEVTEDVFGLEEAYFSTRSLPLGLQLKGGKFLSSFGRLNEQHTHYWDFYDIPLVYNAFFGEGALNEIGARCTLVVPADFYLMLGGEVLRGKNTRSFGVEGFTSLDGVVRISDTNWPELYVGYVKTSFDIGDMVVLAGASAARGRTRINHGIGIAGVSGYAVSGYTTVAGGDLTMKYQFDSIRYLSLQGEYLYRRVDGTLYKNDSANAVSRTGITKDQTGLYVQLTAKLAKQWRCGARYDLLQVNRVRSNHMIRDVPDNLPRYSAMAEYNPTEFSRLRLQYNCDLSRYRERAGFYRRNIAHEVILQVNLAIGAHGAHAF